MTDFHSHVLPCVDDGSDSIETSLSMLRAWKEQGVDRIAVTPHFYADRDHPRRFLGRRAEACDALARAMDEAGLQAELLPGAEVRYFSGMSSAEALDDLCLRGTRLLLLEMPFNALWSENMLRDVAAIRRRGILPVAAHIERYIGLQSKQMIRRFMSLDILIQANAEFFLTRRTAKRALRLLDAGFIHFLGSDAHNNTTRPPNLGKAIDLIRAKLGAEALAHLERYERLTYPEGGLL